MKSLRQIAKEIEVNPGHLSRMVNGKRPWSKGLKERYDTAVANDSGNIPLATLDSNESKMATLDGSGNTLATPDSGNTELFGASYDGLKSRTQIINSDGRNIESSELAFFYGDAYQEPFIEAPSDVAPSVSEVVSSFGDEDGVEPISPTDFYIPDSETDYPSVEERISSDTELDAPQLNWDAVQIKDSYEDEKEKDFDDSEGSERLTPQLQARLDAGFNRALAIYDVEVDFYRKNGRFPTKKELDGLSTKADEQYSYEYEIRLKSGM